VNKSGQSSHALIKSERICLITWRRAECSSTNNLACQEKSSGSIADSLLFLEENSRGSDVWAICGRVKGCDGLTVCSSPIGERDS